MTADGRRLGDELGPVEWRLVGWPAAVDAAVAQLGLEPSGQPRPSRAAPGRVLVYGTLRPQALPGEPDGQLPPLDVLLAAVDHALCDGAGLSGAQLAFELLCARLGVERDGLVFDPGWVVHRLAGRTIAEVMEAGSEHARAALADAGLPPLEDLVALHQHRVEARSAFRAAGDAWAAGRGRGMRLPDDRAAVIALGVPCEDGYCSAVVTAEGQGGHRVRFDVTRGDHWTAGIVASCGGERRG